MNRKLHASEARWICAVICALPVQVGAVTMRRVLMSLYAAPAAMRDYNVGMIYRTPDFRRWVDRNCEEIATVCRYLDRAGIPAGAIT